MDVAGKLENIHVTAHCEISIHRTVLEQKKHCVCPISTLISAPSGLVNSHVRRIGNSKHLEVSEKIAQGAILNTLPADKTSIWLVRGCRCAVVQWRIQD